MIASARRAGAIEAVRAGARSANTRKTSDDIDAVPVLPLSQAGLLQPFVVFVHMVLLVVALFAPSLAPSPARPPKAEVVNKLLTKVGLGTLAQAVGSQRLDWCAISCPTLPW